MDNFNDFLVTIVFLFSHHPVLSILFFILFLTIAVLMNSYNYELGKEEGLDDGYYLTKEWITNIINEYYLNLVEKEKPKKKQSEQDDEP